MRILLYGATGYTGRLIARHAAAEQLPLVLAGRNPAAVAAVAEETGLEGRVFGLDDAAAVRRHIADADVVLNCAGPFEHTWRPLVTACIERGVHYVDVTGEIDVFEGIANLSPSAADAGVVLLPGAGFDVVPTDCLAAHLARRLPGGTRLMLGISGTGPLSHGTASTAIENQDRGGAVRRGGKLLRVPAAWRTRDIDFGDGRIRSAVTIPWGDVATAWYTTGIPDIEVYAAMPARVIRVLRASRRLGWLLRRRVVKAVQRKLLKARPTGPTAHELVHGESRVWGRVEDHAGNAIEAVLRGPNGYRLTVVAALLIAARVAEGAVTAGFQTPGRAFGPDFVLALEGTERRDVQ
jgi:short subunit dehydrogenase-like uncharacterized protein